MKYYLALCSVFKNEATYLQEWLRFYDLVGVEHFYLYNNESADDFPTVLAPWIASGKVTLHHIPGPAAQRSVVYHCLENYRTQCVWLAFLDLDEFLFSPTQPDLRTFLRPYEPEPAVVANWLMFGAAGHQHRPPVLVTLNSTRRCDLKLVPFEPDLLKTPDSDPASASSYHPLCSHVKSIVNTHDVLEGLSPHHFAFREGRVPITAWGER